MTRYIPIALAVLSLTMTSQSFAQTSPGGAATAASPTIASDPSPNGNNSLPGVTNPTTTGSALVSPQAQPGNPAQDTREACHTPGTQSDTNPTATLPVIPSSGAACN